MTFYRIGADGEPEETDGSNFDQTNRHVGLDEVEGHDVSTVLLPVSLLGAGWEWETMVFDPDREEVGLERCGGPRANAEAMHARMVAKWTELLKPAPVTPPATPKPFGSAPRKLIL